MKANSSHHLVLTCKHFPQAACPWGPTGPQKAVQPYLLRHAKGLSASHVEQYALTAFKFHPFCSGLYKWYVALTLEALSPPPLTLPPPPPDWQLLWQLLEGEQKSSPVPQYPCWLQQRLLAHVLPPACLPHLTLNGLSATFYMDSTDFYMICSPI